MQTQDGYEYTFQGVPVVFPYNAYDVQVRCSYVTQHWLFNAIQSALKPAGQRMRYGAEELHGICYPSAAAGALCRALSVCAGQMGSQVHWYLPFYVIAAHECSPGKPYWYREDVVPIVCCPSMATAAERAGALVYKNTHRLKYPETTPQLAAPMHDARV